MKRAQWGGQIGFILATAGSAIGLGNVWRFPYMAGQNGGGTFLFLYLLCVFGLGYFLLLSKLAFGRCAHTNMVDGFSVVAAKNKKVISPWWGKTAGALSLFNTLLVPGVYVVVIGWTLFYLVHAVLYLLHLSDTPLNKTLFEGLTASFGEQLFWSVICIVATMGIIMRGIRKGIEKISLLLMPILFVLLVFMAVRMLLMPDALKGIEFFLKPDFTAMGFTADGFQFKTFAALLLQVMGQAVYSLSLGLGVLFVYGSYLSDKENLLKSTAWIASLDTLVALLSGFIVLPAVFAFHLPPESGPTLSFITLPMVFEQMLGGAFLTVVFFALLFIAAITSLISMYEAAVNVISEKMHLNRTSAVCLVGGLNSMITGIILLSFSKTVPWKINNMDLFSFADILTGSFTMGFLVLYTTLFMGWVVSTAVIQNIQKGISKPLPKFFKRYLRFTLRFTAPLLLIVLFITALTDLINK